MASKQPRSAKYYLNAVHTLFELILRRPSPTNVPIYCLHEPTTGCNLECPACPTGVGLANLKETAELEDYEAVCSEFGQYLDVYYLFNWGEPTMARPLVRILERLKNEPFQVNMSTNFSVPLKDEVIAALATMPNLSLRINVDGATQESHEKYRVNSKLATVMRNSQRLAEAIKTSATPPLRVYFAFLVFSYNKDEAETVAKMASDLGFKFDRYDDPLIAGEPMPANNIKVEDGFGCTWLYSSISPSPRLSHLAPCCGVWDKAMMSARPEGLSLHEAFMQEPRYMSRRQGDADFAALPVQSRVDHLKNNMRNDTAMALNQQGSKVDACVGCTMGSGYQHKLSHLIEGAAVAYARLQQIDVDTARRRLFTALEDLLPGRNPAKRAEMIQILAMPPAKARTAAHYGAFLAYLKNLQ